jgi:transcriptional regulator with XRE-family HTH domain
MEVRKMVKISTFYTKLEQLCKNKGISIARMQRDCGLGNSTSYKWKNKNTMPNVATVNKIATYFNISPNELMPPYANCADVCDASVTSGHKPPNDANNSAAVKGERASDLISIIKLQHETLCEQLRIQNKKNDDLVEIINNLTKSPSEGKALGRSVDLVGVRGV